MHKTLVLLMEKLGKKYLMNGRNRQVATVFTALMMIIMLTIFKLLLLKLIFLEILVRHLYLY